MRWLKQVEPSWGKMRPMPQLYDLHSHSTASDGTLTPSELLQRAVTKGVSVLALTDHDTLDGIEEARRVASGIDISLIAGVEISVSWHGIALHIIGLGVDESNEALINGLSKLRKFRDWRAEEMGRRLAKRGIEGAYEAALELSRGRIVSRTHFARYLVQTGRAKDFGDAIRRYLKRGKPGYVPGQWAELEAVIDWVRNAGGISVLAHPMRYDISATRRRNLFAEYSELGGDAIEIASASHRPDECRTLALVTERHGFYASQGSDFHSPDNRWVELGRFPKLPESCLPVWQHERFSIGENPVAEASN